MKLDYTVYHEQGQRELQQDHWACRNESECACFIVADGFGEKGDIAAQAFTETFMSLIFDYAAALEQTPAETMWGVVSKAHLNLVNTLVEQNAETARTTCAILWCSTMHTIAAHVGDSRLYHFQNGKLIWRSMDHTLADGSSSEARKAPEAHILTRSLGVGKEANPSIHIADRLNSSDCWLLATDGFWEVLPPNPSLDTVLLVPEKQVWLDNASAIIIHSK